MLISHECPISILEDSKEFNSFDYALVHLFETHPEYYKFFQRSVQNGREVLLDNSIFELKEAFDPIKFAKYIHELKPTYYIVPDVLEDARATMSSFKRFTINNPVLPGLSIGVVQGKTYQELVECYQYMSEHADYIAISFDYSWYQTIGRSLTNVTRINTPRTLDEVDEISAQINADDHKAKLERFMTGRQKFIKMLMDDNIWNYNKPHHLLGNSLPQEMKAYQGIESIRSVDTSNPVVAGIKGITYLEDIGMQMKPSVMLADLIDYEVTPEQMADIMWNTSQYNKFCNGK